MLRRVAAAGLLAAAVASVPAHAAPSLGGYCDGYVDVMCRTHRCGEDELDCGLIPPCAVWVFQLGCVVQ